MVLVLSVLEHETSAQSWGVSHKKQVVRVFVCVCARVHACVCVCTRVCCWTQCPPVICVHGGLVYINCKCVTVRITNSVIPEIPIAVNEVFFMTLNLESDVQWECVKKGRDHGFRTNSKWQLLCLVYSDTILQRNNRRRKNTQLLHAEWCHSSHNKLIIGCLGRGV